jgi:hypothetical protein
VEQDRRLSGKSGTTSRAGLGARHVSLLVLSRPLDPRGLRPVQGCIGPYLQQLVFIVKLLVAVVTPMMKLLIVYRGDVDPTDITVAMNLAAMSLEVFVTARPDITIAKMTVENPVRALPVM